MDWHRTGPITLRSIPGDYLIMRMILAPQYLALYGPIAARIDLGRYHTAEDAKACCEAHKAIATVCDQYSKGA